MLAPMTAPAPAVCARAAAATTASAGHLLDSMPCFYLFLYLLKIPIKRANAIANVWALGLLAGCHTGCSGGKQEEGLKREKVVGFGGLCEGFLKKYYFVYVKYRLIVWEVLCNVFF